MLVVLHLIEALDGIFIIDSWVFLPLMVKIMTIIHLSEAFEYLSNWEVLCLELYVYE